MSRKPYKRKYTYSSSPTTSDTMILEEIIEAPRPVLKSVALYQVQINHPSLRRRGGPSLQREVVGYITDKGIYNIYAEENGWGKLEDNSWIKLEYTSRIKK